MSPVRSFIISELEGLIGVNNKNKTLNNLMFKEKGLTG